MQNKYAKDRVLQVRKYFGLSRKDFSKALKTSLATISRIESGILEPSEAFINALTIRFLINPDWILTGQGDMFISPEEYIVKGIKLLGAQKFSEGLKSALADPEFAQVRSAIALNELVKDIVHQELAVYLRHIIDLWQQKDERTRTWLLVQLERAFPEVGEGKGQRK